MTQRQTELLCRAAQARVVVHQRSSPSGEKGIRRRGRGRMPSYKLGDKPGSVPPLRRPKTPSPWRLPSGKESRSARLGGTKARRPGGRTALQRGGSYGEAGVRGGGGKAPNPVPGSSILRFLRSRRGETGPVSQCGESKRFPAPRCDSTLAPSGFNFRLGRRRDDEVKLTTHLPQVDLE